MFAFEIRFPKHFRDAAFASFAFDFLQYRAREGGHDFPIKLLTAVLAQGNHDVLKRTPALVRPVCGHRIKRIRKRHDLRAYWNLLVYEAIRITTPVDTFMMVFRHQRYV